jgi:hypothetical protein
LREKTELHVCLFHGEHGAVKILVAAGGHVLHLAVGLEGGRVCVLHEVFHEITERLGATGFARLGSAVDRELVLLLHAFESASLEPAADRFDSVDRHLLPTSRCPRPSWPWIWRR